MVCLGGGGPQAAAAAWQRVQPGLCLPASRDLGKAGNLPSFPFPACPMQHLLGLDIPTEPLASLTRLRYLYLRTCGPPAAQQLPPGPWLRSLRQLSVHASVAASSLPNLAAATRLQRLCVWDASDEQLAAIFCWAAEHGPRLRQLVIGRVLMGADAWAELLDVARQRPGLQITRGYP